MVGQSQDTTHRIPIFNYSFHFPTKLSSSNHLGWPVGCSGLNGQIKFYMKHGSTCSAKGPTRANKYCYKAGTTTKYLLLLS